MLWEEQAVCLTSKSDDSLFLLKKTVVRSSRGSEEQTICEAFALHWSSCSSSLRHLEKRETAAVCCFSDESDLSFTAKLLLQMNAQWLSKKMAGRVAAFTSWYTASVTITWLGGFFCLLFFLLRLALGFPDDYLRWPPLFPQNCWRRTTVSWRCDWALPFFRYDFLTYLK